MACCARAAPLLLTHVNLLLFLYAGAGLATAARLKWDPSTYIVLREMFPMEYRPMAVAFCVGSVALLLLGHLCATALASTGVAARRLLFLVYAVGMALLVASEIACATWMGFRVAEFLRSERARRMAEMTPIFDQLKVLLDQVSGWAEWLNRIKMLVQEAEEDAIRNVYVAGATVGLLCVLQPLAVVLALLAARGAAFERPRARRRQSHSWATVTSTASVEKLVDDAEKAPLQLRTAYRNGRIVIL